MPYKVSLGVAPVPRQCWWRARRQRTKALLRRKARGDTRRVHFPPRAGSKAAAFGKEAGIQLSL